MSTPPNYPRIWSTLRSCIWLKNLVTHPGVEAALSPVELVLFGAGLADAPRVHLGRLGLDVRVVEAAQHDAEVQHGKPSEESISIMGSFFVTLLIFPNPFCHNIREALDKRGERFAIL